MADITYSPSDDMSDVIFSASTPKGEEWMGSKEVRQPAAEANSYLTAALDAGLIVKPFP